MSSATRGRSDLRFCDPAALEPCDVLFLAGAHDDAADEVRELEGRARHVVDLSARFRLRALSSRTSSHLGRFPAGDQIAQPLTPGVHSFAGARGEA